MKSTTRYTNKTILVMGLAKSGKAAARILKQLGARVIINDMTPLESSPDGQEMVAEGFEVVAGGHPLELLDRGLDLIVKNPGIPYRKVPLLMKAQELGIPILTEVEIAYDISEAPFIGITATNGKTTTTTLIYEMLKEGQRHPLIAGNIGEVAVSVAQAASKEQVMVTELSSFQLMGIDQFKPYISLILNITEAHLDYHTDIHEYRQAKHNLVLKQTADQFFVYNADDPIVVKALEKTAAQPIPFSLEKEVDGAYVREGAVYYRGEFIMRTEEILLKGDHNLQDVLGAVAVCQVYGCPAAAMVRVLRRFSGVRHRLQFVDEVGGVKYYNNSKATNVIATEMALKAFDGPVVLIAGGLDRGHDLTPLADHFQQVKAILAFGETKDRFKKLAMEHGIPCQTFELLEETVPAAAALGTAGDYVLFSPACASWDQYLNFEVRGDSFIEMVEKL